MDMNGNYVNDPRAATSVPDRCTKINVNRSWRCKEAVCRNLNGTWSALCQKHKDHVNDYTRRQTTGIDIAGYFNDRSEKNKMFEAVTNYRSAKRKWSDIQDRVEKLIKTRTELHDKIKVIDAELGEHNKVGLAAKQAKDAMMAVIEE